ncbi:CMP-N-acetylneuraminate-beta-galactosamide-alpha-2,3-sialyltransferase 2-like [Lytechinus variegatus]|uniref:CMP-N-acetylneuraminate-beta-galactosamide- alpha-2,3-sialyltransferase 2-like n=1 Tax=Lytechinus variegatus TaxID=7654 RepID=UPI001BB166F2|nr:CMP-N-acetylneuraminate-beta-galactosamide-alpha-2,3-sialyltransferase 2-like [Lytechinus variegatus]
MARWTWKTLTLVTFVCIVIKVGYSGLKLDRTDASKRDSRHSTLVSYEHKTPYTSKARMNSTTTSSGGRRCQRLWEKGTSEWFDKRFNASLLPVWMKENAKLSEEIKKWWLRLQSHVDKDYLGALDKAFKVIPNPERFLKRNRSRCLRCAVVGNSGNLKNSSYGTLIDTHDAVVRINRAKVKGFEKDVGKKDTYRLMYPESFTDITPETTFVLLGFKVLDLNWARSAITTGEIKKTYTSVKAKIKVAPSKILFYNPTLMHHIHKEWIDGKGRYPSSGTLAVFFALQFCDEVSVFGMGANSKGYWDHYWEANDGSGNSAFLKTHVHNSDHELEILKKLAEEKIIKMYQGVR